MSVCVCSKYEVWMWRCSGFLNTFWAFYIFIMHIIQMLPSMELIINFFYYIFMYIIFILPLWTTTLCTNWMHSFILRCLSLWAVWIIHHHLAYWSKVGLNFKTGLLESVWSQECKHLLFHHVCMHNLLKYTELRINWNFGMFVLCVNSYCPAASLYFLFSPCC